MELERKRVLTSAVSTTPKGRRNREHESQEINLIESLPDEILVKVLCNVNYCYLKHLLLVSKSFCKAALVAREIHHLYNTPVKPDSEKVYRSPHVEKCVRNRDRMFMPAPEEYTGNVAVILFQDDED